MAGIDDVANIAQLTGLDAVKLIGLIVKAANTARMHRKNCRQFANHLKLIGNLLEQLKISELKRYPETGEPLEQLEDALRRSYLLVQAYDEREGDNPSWFNRTEASMVVKLIKKLINKDVSEEDIGVITPYRQQVAKIKKALENDEIHDVKIGSVEQFQGQEREVIIISTVRSTVKHDQFDRIHYLGFLSNPKRFNVSITRARSLLVIIGNPHIICKDPYWEKLLWRCVDNNSYEGCSLPERQQWCSDEIPVEAGWSHDAAHQQNFVNNSGSYKSLPAVDGWSLDAVVQENSQELFPDGSDIPNPIKDEDQWSDGWKDSGQELSWDDGNIPEPAINENEWSDEKKENNQELSRNNGDYLEPVKNEDEWSDGWK